MALLSTTLKLLLPIYHLTSSAALQNSAKSTTSKFIGVPPQKIMSSRRLLSPAASQHLTPQHHDALLVPPGMTSLHIGVPFASTAIEEIDKLNVKRVYVMANKSSHAQPAVRQFVELLEKKGVLAAPINCDVSMGGAEDGLFKACNEAAEVNADCVLTIGGGAVQDAGKFVRLWLSATAAEVDENNGQQESTTASATTATSNNDDDDTNNNNNNLSNDNTSDEVSPKLSRPTKKVKLLASIKGIQAATQNRTNSNNNNNSNKMTPQICLPNSFAMAELTHVAGLVTKDNVKSGAAHPDMMPTVVIFDTTLTRGLPDWVRFGTALRGIEHGIGAVCHPKATPDIRSRALLGLELVNSGLKRMVQDPNSEEAQLKIYLGGWMAIRALNTGCYPSIAHSIQNQYSARFHVHQGSCSGILCARILEYHREVSGEFQSEISRVLSLDDEEEEEGDDESSTSSSSSSSSKKKLRSAPQLVSDLVATLPGVAKDHKDANVDEAMLRDFAEYMYSQHGERMNSLSPKPFCSIDDFWNMLTLPLDESSSSLEK